MFEVQPAGRSSLAVLKFEGPERRPLLHPVEQLSHLEPALLTVGDFDDLEAVHADANGDIEAIARRASASPHTLRLHLKHFPLND